MTLNDVEINHHLQSLNGVKINHLFNLDISNLMTLLTLFYCKQKDCNDLLFNSRADIRFFCQGFDLNDRKYKK